MLRPLLWPPPTERSMFHMSLVNTVVPLAFPSWLVFLLFSRLSRPIYLLTAVPSAVPLFHLVLGCPSANNIGQA